MTSGFSFVTLVATEERFLHLSHPFSLSAPSLPSIHSATAAYVLQKVCTNTVHWFLHCGQGMRQWNWSCLDADLASEDGSSLTMETETRKGVDLQGNCSSHGCLLLSLLELSCFHHPRCRRLSEFFTVWRLRFFDIFWANDLSRSSGFMTSSAFLNAFDIKFGKDSWLHAFICQLKKLRAQKSQWVGLF